MKCTGNNKNKVFDNELRKPIRLIEKLQETLIMLIPCYCPDMIYKGDL